ncbi:DUF2478 domain-containing protein [Aquicoccus sp. SU-CL01552]
MLGYVVVSGQGDAGPILREVAARLDAAGVAVAGAIQSQGSADAQGRCHMELRVLPGDAPVRISQDLGALSQGCRLDPDGLERAVAMVGRALEAGPQIVIVNKFGKQEGEGRGFRSLIGTALMAGVPVLLAVAEGDLERFLAFAETLADPLPTDPAALVAWCRTRIGQD